jgi:uncharacterized protein YbjT (DUF2867 family)
VVELIDEGRPRMQPIGVADACAAILAAARQELACPLVMDLVGPTPVSYRALVEAVAEAAGRRGSVPRYVVRSLTAAEAQRQAVAGGYRGLLPDELDVLLCDEVSDPAPVERLLGRALAPLAAVLDDAVAGSQARTGGSFRR